MPPSLGTPLGLAQRKRASPRGEAGTSGDGGISWVFSSCGASIRFLTRYNRELSEPLMWCQGSQVSMHVVRGPFSPFTPRPHQGSCQSSSRNRSPGGAPGRALPTRKSQRSGVSRPMSPQLRGPPCDPGWVCTPELGHPSPVLGDSPLRSQPSGPGSRGCGGARGDPGPAALLPGYPCGPSPGPLHLPAQTRVASGFPPSLQLQRPQARGSRLGTRRAREPPETGYLGDSCCGGGGSSSSVDVSRQL